MFSFSQGKNKVDPSFLNKISFDPYISYMRLIYRYNQTWADIVSARNRNQIFRCADCLGAVRHLDISGNSTEIFLYRLVVVMDKRH